MANVFVYKLWALSLSLDVFVDVVDVDVDVVSFIHSLGKNTLPVDGTGRRENCSLCCTDNHYAIVSIIITTNLVKLKQTEFGFLLLLSLSLVLLLFISGVISRLV